MDAGWCRSERPFGEIRIRVRKEMSRVVGFYHRQSMRGLGVQRAYVVKTVGVSVWVTRICYMQEGVEGGMSRKNPKAKAAQVVVRESRVYYLFWVGFAASSDSPDEEELAKTPDARSGSGGETLRVCAVGDDENAPCIPWSRDVPAEEVPSTKADRGLSFGGGGGAGVE